MSQAHGNTDTSRPLVNWLEACPFAALAFDKEGLAIEWNREAASTLKLGNCLRPYAFATTVANGAFSPSSVIQTLKQDDSKRIHRIFLGRQRYEVTWRPLWVGEDKFLLAHLRALEKLSIRSLLPSSQTLHHTLEFLPVGVVSYTLEGIITYYNAAAGKLYGWNGGEMFGLPSPFPWPIANLFHCLSQLEGDSLEIVSERSIQDRMLQVRLTISPYLDESGEILGYLEVSEDLTVLRDQERQLEQSKQALGQLKKLEAVARLAGGMAHDFNNLLQIVRCCAELQLASNDLEPDLVHQILETTERGQALTRQLLTFARSQHRAKCSLDLAEALRHLKPLLLSCIRSRLSKFDLQLQLQEGLKILGDITSFEQVIVNLVMNAADASEEGCKIEIKLSQNEFDKPFSLRSGPLPFGSYAKISIVDEGVGISTANLERLFEPFFTTKPQGNGLGLASAYGTVLEHRGGIDLQSTVGNGTVVSIYFPLEPANQKITQAGNSSENVRGYRFPEGERY